MSNKNAFKSGSELVKAKAEKKAVPLNEIFKGLGIDTRNTSQGK